ncbi:hypothetical protein ACIGYO_17090 [Streptomyces triculaminicus]
MPSYVVAINAYFRGARHARCAYCGS